MAIKRQQGIKKSEFSAKTGVDSGATFDYVVNGQNFKISDTDFYSALGVTGSLVQDGAITGTPILDTQGTVNNIRNIEDGPGLISNVSPDNGVLLQHNFQTGNLGVPVLINPTESSPAIANITAGAGIQVVADGNNIRVDATGTPEPSSKKVKINSESDFPTPSGGVITLEAGTVYDISNDITTANRFVLLDNTSVVSHSGLAPVLTYTGTGVMFTGADTSNWFANLRLDCPTGTIWDISESGVVPRIVSINNVIVDNCDTIGVFSQIGSLGFFNSAVLNVVTTGISVSGTAMNLFSANQLAFSSSSTTMVGIDLGTASYLNIEIRDTLIVGLGAGSIGIKGTTGSGNLLAGSVGTVSGCNFIGAITPLNTITVDDVRWDFTGNGGIPNTMQDALTSLSSNATATVISAINTPAKVLGTWVEQDASFFTTDASGTITYVGERDSKQPVDMPFNALMSTGGSHQVTGYIALNGVVIPETAVQVTCTSSQSGAGTCIWQHDFVTGDYVELFIENNTDSSNIIVNGVIRVN